MSKNTNSKIATIAQSAFEAGLGETSWDNALRDLVGSNGAAGGALFKINRTTHEISQWHSINLNDKEEYLEEMNAINPRMHYSASHDSTHIMIDYDCISKEELARHEFYRWLETRCHLQFFIGGRILDVGDTSTFMSIEFEAGEAPPSRRAVEDFRTTSIHFANAQRLANNRNKDEPASDLDSFLAQKTTTALFFLDGKCRYFFTNPAGEKLVSRQRELSLVDGFVTLSDTTSQSKLGAYYRSIQETENVLVLKPFSPIFVPEIDGNLSLLIRVFYLPYPLKGPGNKWSTICLFVQSASEKEQEIICLLIETFSLTRREAQLALSLQENVTIAEAARALGIAHNTARVHLHRIFQKMNVQSQSELAVLVERFSAWL